MISMDRTAPEGRAVQLLAVLALLLGLLTMHGLISAHHSPTPTAVPSGAAPAGQQYAAVAAPGRADPHHTAAHTADAAAVVAPTGLPGVGALGGTCLDCPVQGTTALCLAVLSVGLGLVARRASAGGVPAPRVRLPLLCPGPLPCPRPPDLVAGLCVSRT